MVYTLRLRLNLRDRLILLLDQHRHLVKHLSELGQGLFNLLDLGVAFLHLAVGTTSGTVAVRVEQLPRKPRPFGTTDRDTTYSLRKHLRIVRLGHLPDLLLGRLRIDNLVLPLHTVLDLFPKLLFNHLVLLQQRGEARLARLDLCLLGTVALGELEQLFDLVLALFALYAGLVV